MIPGEYFIQNEFVNLNSERKTLSLKVSNTRDRPVQVGSHFHFFEVNSCLEFDRKSALCMRLDIPSGTAIRFEPGEEKEVQLVEIGGKREVHGLNDLTSGMIDQEKSLENALKKARDFGFKGVE